jgi:protein-L-isoaspartate(D-aspartate) O-methyltransferase
MTQALTLEPRCRVLEIGTGSGYQTAVLSRVSRLVYTIERYRTLMKEAEARFAQAGPDQRHHEIWGWMGGLGQTGAV